MKKKNKKVDRIIRAKKITVGIVGATGYVGQELVRLLLNHPQVEIKALVSQSSFGKSYAQIYPSFSKFINLPCIQEEVSAVAKYVDVIFFALPHGAAARQVNEELINTIPVIDLGADFRLKNPAAYEKWYGYKHPCHELLSQSVYGLCELRREAIRSARIIANPGCYATCSILALKPLIVNQIVDPGTLVIDAKSGVSGAGRSLELGVHFNECNESIKPYKVGQHRHTPEIEQELRSSNTNESDDFAITFTPHLVPMNRGILVTAYGSLLSLTDESSILEVYRKTYGKEQFVRLFEPQDGEYAFPETRWVKGSNYCDIGLRVDHRTGRIIVIAALDNLVKGAAGQAVQNLNILFGLEETMGLTQAPIFPA